MQSDPPQAALDWAAAVDASPAGSGATARVVRRLAGGTHAATHVLATTSPPREMVLRRFPVGDDAAAREAYALTALDGLDGWAPRLVDVDADGRRFGEPATLIDLLPGRADITPTRPCDAATQMGAALARVHAVPTERLDGLRDGVAAGAVSDTGDAGPAAPVVAAHAQRLAAQPRVLTHFDFWSGNVLWQQDRLTGIVDWSGAALAPRGFDVGWCRLDLVLLHGGAVADAFLAAYEAAAGGPVPEMALWDLFALTNSHRSVEPWVPNYRDLGRLDLTANELRRRHADWSVRCLARYAASLARSSATPTDWTPRHRPPRTAG